MKHGPAEQKRILAILDQPPLDGYGNWMAVLLARALGDIHEQYIWRFLRAQKIDLSCREFWCENNDPEFVANAAEIVGLYIIPPENAVVLPIDKKRSTDMPKRNLWLAHHPKVHFHYRPTHTSWLNQIEIGFRSSAVSHSAERRSKGVDQLKTRIDSFIQSYNEDAWPFIWTTSKVHQKRLKPSVADQ